MLMPAIFGSNLFDGWMDDEFRDLDKMDREMNKKLYGHEAGHVMKTDVRELADHYEVDIDLPGFKKDEISAKLENGYLTVSAAKKHDNRHILVTGLIFLVIGIILTVIWYAAFYNV